LVVMLCVPPMSSLTLQAYISMLLRVYYRMSKTV
jgi:hypothetical protein